MKMQTEGNKVGKHTLNQGQNGAGGRRFSHQVQSRGRQATTGSGPCANKTSSSRASRESIKRSVTYFYYYLLASWLTRVKGFKEEEEKEPLGLKMRNCAHTFFPHKNVD